MSYQAIYLALSPGTRTGQVVEKGLQDITQKNKRGQKIQNFVIQN